MSDFGDIEPEDSFDQEGTPDPEQVAQRLHELRAYLADLYGHERLERFNALTPAERSLANAVGVAIVNWLLTHEPDDAEAAARDLHNVRRYWSGNVLPEWEDLPEDQRAIGIDIMRHLVAWLEREGPL